MIRYERLAQVFVELADTLVTDFDAVDFLHTLTDSSVEVMDVQAAGLMLADQRGTLHVAASTGEVDLLELFELEQQRGPCIECFSTGAPVVNIDPPHARERWPQFTDLAGHAGFASVHAFPLRLREEVIGAINLYCTHQRTLDPVELSVAQALADIATIGLLQERIIRDKTVLTEQLQSALNTRILIEQAKGVVAERTGLSMAQAFTAMRSHARNHQQSLPTVATAVIAGTVDTSGWVAD